MAALWALAAGRPYVGPDLPLTRGVAGEAGLYFDPEDSTSIAEVVERALADAELRQRLADAARARHTAAQDRPNDELIATLWDEHSG